MRVRFFVGKTLKDESGAILVIMAFFVVIMTLLFAGLAEFGRYLVLKEQLQTAGDAAALAGIIAGGKRHVKIEVTSDPGLTWRSERDCYTDSNNITHCHTHHWCESCGEVSTQTVVGEERDLIDNGGWSDYCKPPCGDCGGYSCDYKLIDRWVEYEKGSFEASSDDVFYSNPVDQATHVEIERKVVKDGSKDSAPYVLIYAKAKMKSLFAGLFGIFPDSYTVRTCSQGDTSYIDPNTGEWVNAPPDACWKD